MSRGSVSNLRGSSQKSSARLPWIRATPALPSLQCRRPRPCASRSRAGRSSYCCRLLLLLVWAVAGAVRHVLFLFLVALLIALLLNPLVRGLGRAWIPRGPAVALVYLAFAAVVALAILALATVVVQQTRNASHRVDNYFTVDSGHPPKTGAEQDLARLQGWLDHHHLSGVHVQQPGSRSSSTRSGRRTSRSTRRERSAGPRAPGSPSSPSSSTPS